MIQTPTENRIKVCIVCGKQFVPYRSSEKVCSNNCRNERLKQNRRNYEINHREERKGKRKSPKKASVICLYCGKTIHSPNKNQLFCDYNCRQRMYRKNCDHKKLQKLPSLRIRFQKKCTTRKAVVSGCVNTWRESVEHIMSLPYSERYGHTMGWGNREHNYAKEIEMQRIREDELFNSDFGCC